MTIENKIINYFKDKNPILIYLFGSYAKKTQNNESDIDIAVLFDSSISSKKTFDYKMDLVNLLEKETDLIDLSNANIILKHQIIINGKNLFNRTQLEADEYKYRILSCYYQYKEDVRIVKASIKKRGYIYGRSHSGKNRINRKMH